MFMLPYYVRNDIRKLCQNMIKPFLDSSTGKMGLVATFANILGQKLPFAPAFLINIIYINHKSKKVETAISDTNQKQLAARSSHKARGLQKCYFVLRN